MGVELKPPGRGSTCSVAASRRTRARATVISGAGFGLDLSSPPACASQLLNNAELQMHIRNMA